MDLKNKLEAIQKKIVSACERSQRNPHDIRVLLATKTVSPSLLCDVLNLNYRLFGENKVQELIEKQSQLKSQEIEWHFIGRLQTNKVKDVLHRCTLIHSLDRLSLAQEIQKRATQPTPVLIEIHSTTEASKAGISPHDLTSFVRELESLDKISIQGVMTLAANTEDPAQIRQCFRETRQCFEALQKLQPQNKNIKYLSMGMSHDFEIAIEEGANIIRIGSAVFGERPKSIT